MSFTSTSKMPFVIRVIAAARALSVVGDEIALIALVFRAKNEIGHWGVAALMLAGAAPLIVMSPLAGLLVDRVRARRLILVTSLVQTAVCVAIALAGTNEFIALIALLACATSIIGPAWQALVPTIVTDEQLPAATGILQTFFAFAGIAGPVLGGLLFASFGFRTAILVDAASFLLLTLVPVFVAADRVPRSRSENDGTKDNALSGYRSLAHTPVLRALMTLGTFVILSVGVINVVEIYFTTRALHAGPRGYGLIGMCFGLGMLLAAAGTSRLSRRFTRTERVLVASMVALVAMLFILSQVRTLWQAAIAVFLVGVVNSVTNVQMSLLLVRATESFEHLRGRVFAAVNGLFSGAQISAIALGGFLLGVWSPRMIIAVGAAACAVALVFTSRALLRAYVESSTEQSDDSASATGELEAAL